MRDDVQQTEQFTLNAPTGRHDDREKSLGSVGAAGPAVVLPVRVNFSIALLSIRAEERRGLDDMKCHCVGRLE